MTAGQHKGEMTQVLMKKYKTESPCIVHVDDHARAYNSCSRNIQKLKDKSFYFSLWC